MLIIELLGSAIPTREQDSGQAVWHGGHANQLSSEAISYPQIDAIHSATKFHGRACRCIVAAEPPRNGSGEIKLPPPTLSRRPFGEVARMRRSALDFLGGTQSMSLPQLSAILTSAMRPLLADFAGAGFIQLYLYAHRVAGLEPGVYRLWPEAGELEQIVRGDQRVAAAGLSLGQDLAGNACVAFGLFRLKDPSSFGVTPVLLPDPGRHERLAGALNTGTAYGGWSKFKNLLNIVKTTFRQPYLRS